MTDRTSDPATTTPELLTALAEKAPSGVAFVYGGERWTYGQWLDASKRVASALADMGVGRGSVVGILMTNRPEWLVGLMAANWLGASIAAFNTWAGDWDLDYMLRQSGTEALISLDQFRGRSYIDTLRGLIPEIHNGDPGQWSSQQFPALRELIVVGSTAIRGGRRWEDCIVSPPLEAEAIPLPTDVALVLYTSGSTARPKGVSLVHQDLIANGDAIAERMGIISQDRIWVAVPLFWSYGSANALMVALTHQATLILQEAFSAVEALGLIDAERATVGYFLPHLTRAMYEAPSFDRSLVKSLRTGLTIGLPHDVHRLYSDFGIEGICNVYGATETYGNCCVTPFQAPIERRMASQGPPLEGMTLKILDLESGQELPPGETGEITVSGRITPGYHNDPELSSTSIHDGYYRSGDIGRVDDEGWLTYHGRATEMIKTGGINVAPAEVEEFLALHPDVVQVAVVGIPDDEKGEIVAAGIVARGSLNETDIRDFCEGRIARFKLPQRIVFLDELPATDTGKLSRKALLEQMIKGH